LKNTAHGLPPLSAFFVDRPGVISKMDQIFSNRHLSSSRIMILSGMGGSGKTQVMAKFARLHAHECVSSDSFAVARLSNSRFDHILFIDSSSDITIWASLVAKVRSLLGPKSVKNIEDALALLANPRFPLTRNWAIIYDNADDTKVEYASFFPKCDHGYIFLTTRNAGLQVLSPLGHVKVDVMPIEEAVGLLMKTGFSTNVAPDSQILDQARAVVEHLGCLPIAIVQAGCLMKMRCYSLEGYLSQLMHDRAQLLDYRIEATLEAGHRGIYAALDVTRPFLSPRVLKMISILSFLQPTGIPLQLIFWGAESGFSLQLYDFLPHQEDYKTSVDLLQLVFMPTHDSSQGKVWELIDELQRYSLVSLVQGKSATIPILRFHGLVFAWTQDRLSRAEIELYRQAAVRLLVCGAVEHNEDSFAALIPHVELMMGHRNRFHINELAGLMNVVRIQGKANDLAQGWEYIQDKIIQKYGTEDSRATEATLHLADAYLRAGKDSDASKLEREIVELCRRTLGNSHPLTLRALAQRATGFYTHGQYEDAERLQQEVLASRRQLEVVDKALLAQAMEDLADSYEAQGLSEDAKDLRVEALKLRKEIHAPNYSNICRLEELISKFRDDEGAVPTDTPLQQAIFKSDDQWERRFDQEWRLIKADTGPSLPETTHKKDIDRLQRKADLYEFQGLYEGASRLRYHILGMRAKALVPSNIDIEEALNAVRHTDEPHDATKDTLQRRLQEIHALLETLVNLDDPAQNAIFIFLDADFALLTHNQYPNFPSDSPTIVKGLLLIFQNSILDYRKSRFSGRLGRSKFPDCITPKLATWIVILSATRMTTLIDPDGRGTFELVRDKYRSLGRIEDADMLKTLLCLADMHRNFFRDWELYGRLQKETADLDKELFNCLRGLSLEHADPVEAIGRLTQGSCTRFSQVLRLIIAGTFIELSKGFSERPIYSRGNSLLWATWARLCACRMSIDCLEDWPSLNQEKILAALGRLLDLYQAAMLQNESDHLKSPDLFPQWDEEDAINFCNRSVDMTVIPGSEPSISLFNSEKESIHILIENNESRYRHSIVRDYPVTVELEELAYAIARCARPISNPPTNVSDWIKKQLFAALEILHAALRSPERSSFQDLQPQLGRVASKCLLCDREWRYRGDPCPLDDMKVLVDLCVTNQTMKEGSVTSSHETLGKRNMCLVQ